MIHGWRQQKAVFAIETLVIAGIPLGLAVASAQVDRVSDAGDSASVFKLHDPLLEQTLSPASHDQCFAFGVSNPRIGLDCRFDVMLPYFHVRIFALRSHG